MKALRPLTPQEGPAVAAQLDASVWALRWLLAFLRHLPGVPESFLSEWRLLACGPESGPPSNVLAHFFRSGTTFVAGEGFGDWKNLREPVESEFLPERIVGERSSLEAWRASDPTLFSRAGEVRELKVLVCERRGLSREDPPRGFRAARSDDLPLLEAFERSHYLETGLEPVEVDLSELVERNLIFVVEDGGRVAGSVRSNLSDGRYVHAGGLYVRPEARGRGVGRRLAQGVAWWIESFQGARAVLDAYADNEPALRAYRAAGFRPVGEGLEVRFPRDAWS